MINKLYDVKIDFEKPVQIPIMRFVQHDSKSSGFKFFLEGITDLDVGHKLQIVFIGDYFEPIYDLATITGGSTAEYLLKSDVLSKEGCFKALVSLLGTSYERLTSTVSLTFEVTPSPDPDVLPVANDDRLPVLTELISSVNQLDQLLKSNDSLRASAEASRVLAETNRNTAENQRISNEVYRQASEDDRQAEFDQIKTQFSTMTTEQTSNAEVIVARMDVDGVQHGSLKEHLDTWENSVKVLSDKLDKEQSKPITVTDITTVDDAYGGPVDFVVKGATLNQAVKNGNFSNGLTNWKTVQLVNTDIADGVAVFTVNGTTARLDNLSSNGKCKANDKIFWALDYSVSNEINGYDTISIFRGTTEKGVKSGAPSDGKLYRYYGIQSSGEEGDIGKWRIYFHNTNSTGQIKIGNSLQINITGTVVENWTADQINYCLLSKAYWEGMSGVKNPLVRRVGDNVFTTDNMYSNSLYLNIRGLNALKETTNRSLTSGSRFLFKLKPNAQYTFKEKFDKFGSATNAYQLIYDSKFSQIGIINTPTSPAAFTFTSPSDGIVIIEFARTGGSTHSDGYIEFYDIQLNEGSVAKDYTQYNEALVSTVLQLYDLPNLVADELSQINGKNVIIARTNGGKNQTPYLLNSADIVAVTSGSTQWVRFKVPTDAKAYGVDGTNFATSLRFGDFKSENGTISADLINSIGKLVYSTTSHFNLVYPFGTFVDLTDAKNQLAGKPLLYELATPLIMNEEQFDDKGIVIIGDGVITALMNQSNTFIVSGERFNPETNIKYDLNIFTAFDSVKDVLSETRKLVSFLLSVQDQQDALLLDHENRLSIIEGA